MEIYRRLGIAAKLRNVGLPKDYPNDVSYRTSFIGSVAVRAQRPTSNSRPEGPIGTEGSNSSRSATQSLMLSILP
jgi:hypothetical protein